MGRSEGDFKHLLDTNADQNIGNSTLLQPQPGSVPTTIPLTNPARILQLSGPSKTAQTVSIVFTASRIVGSDNPNPGYAGPVTGILEFGNGGRFTKVEFDVPVGPFLGSFQGAAASSEPQDGGVIVTVPSGVLRAYARYDNLLVQPALGLPPTRATAQLLGVPFVGPGGPVLPPSQSPAPAEPVLVKAMAAYYPRHFARAYKTQYCYVGAPGFIAQYIGPGYAIYCVPAFARTVKLLRWNSNLSTMPSMVLQFFDGINFLEQVTIAAGAVAPIIDLVGNETIIQVLSASPADTITFLALCYEIGL